MKLQEPASLADIVRELGDLDPTTRERILAIGPTVADLVDARAWLYGGDPDATRGAPGPTVQRVVDAVRAVGG